MGSSGACRKPCSNLPAASAGRPPCNSSKPSLKSCEGCCAKTCAENTETRQTTIAKQYRVSTPAPRVMGKRLFERSLLRRRRTPGFAGWRDDIKAIGRAGATFRIVAVSVGERTACHHRQPEGVRVAPERVAIRNHVFGLCCRVDKGRRTRPRRALSGGVSSTGGARHRRSGPLVVGPRIVSVFGSAVGCDNAATGLRICRSSLRRRGVAPWVLLDRRCSGGRSPARGGCFTPRILLDRWQRRRRRCRDHCGTVRSRPGIGAQRR